MSTKGGIRRDERQDSSAIVQVTWKDRAGNAKFANARSLDISQMGMRIEMPEELEKQAYVTLMCNALSLQGSASVRSCVRKGTKYLVGLEFSGGLKWKPKP